MRLAELIRIPLACPFLAALPLVAGELKVDINRDGKNTAAQTAGSFTQWATSDAAGTLSKGTAAIIRSFEVPSTKETVTISVAMPPAAQQAGATGLTYTYHAASSLAEDGKLAGDGLAVEPSIANPGGQIEMTITGLAAGNHSLLTYHNAGDSALQLGTLAPIKISVNGAHAATVMPSIRANDRATPAAYVTFSTRSPQDVTTILFAADTSVEATTKNVFLNGFEIDTSNEARMAKNPSPSDLDREVDARSGNITLSWSTAQAGASDSHDLYFGTSLEAVQGATRASPVFLGNQTENSRQVPITDRNATYYWRVDERDELGNVNTGAVWSFTPALAQDGNVKSQPVFVSLGGKDMRQTVTIPSPGFGWNYSAVAPVPGDCWNRIPRVAGVDVTGPALAPAGASGARKTGIYPLDTLNKVALVDPAGKPSSVRLSVQVEVNTLATDKARSEPTVHNKSKGALPAGLMDTAWRVFLPQNNLRFTITGLVPGLTYDFYGYAAALDPANNPDGANDGALFTLAVPNRVAGSKGTGETKGGYCASVLTYNPETSKITPSPSGTTWVDMPAVADSKGQIEFSTGRNSSGRHFVNGFQLVPRAAKP